jgi:pyrimidine-nucleoside phosphorylase
MVIARLIERKRDGGALAPEEWHALIHAFALGEVPDYQVAALAMAVVFRGLEPQELVALTDAMLDSGDRLRWDGFTQPRVDKHSTGGVGDNTSLLLVPMLAALGAAVPMMSGRALGHTGGTLDKLEAIAGFRTRLGLREAEAQVRRIGCAMLGQTHEIAPADGRLYALRDVTGTVESVPLIAASIMSKKLAEGLNALVLDVKRGSGAFLPRLESAIELAQTMIGLGGSHGCHTVALLTAMDRPLGHACGNALEVEEAIAGLRGEGPTDLMEVTYALGAEMLLASGLEADRSAARRRLEQVIGGGHALDKLQQMIEAQGGNPAVVDDPGALPQARHSEVWAAPQDGLVSEVEPREIGRAIIAMGGGRQRVSDHIDHSVGFHITVKPGHRVMRGQPLATIHAREEHGLEFGRRALASAVRFGEAAAPLPLVSHRVTPAGVEVLA